VVKMTEEVREVLSAILKAFIMGRRDNKAILQYFQDIPKVDLVKIEGHVSYAEQKASDMLEAVQKELIKAGYKVDLLKLLNEKEEKIVISEKF